MSRYLCYIHMLCSRLMFTRNSNWTVILLHHLINAYSPLSDILQKAVNTVHNTEKDWS